MDSNKRQFELLGITGRRSKYLQDSIKDVWLSYDIRRDDRLNEAVYTTTGILHAELEFEFSHKRLNWYIAAVYERHVIENVIGNGLEAKLIISLDRNNFHVRRGSKPDRQVKAMNKTARTYWLKYDDTREFVDKMRVAGYLNVIPGSHGDGRTTTVSCTPKLKAIFETPFKIDEAGYVDFVMEKRSLKRDKSLFIQLKDTDKNLTDTIATQTKYRTKDMLKANSTLKAIHDWAWTTETNIEIILLQENIDKMTTSEHLSLYNILSGPYVSFIPTHELPSHLQSPTTPSIRKSYGKKEEDEGSLSPVNTQECESEGQPPNLPEDKRLKAGGYRLNYLMSFDRIHNNGRWDNGGRLYGLIQNIPSKFRKHIRIKAMPIVGLDYSCFHILMLAHMHGIEVPKGHDAYSSEKLNSISPDRDFHKEIVNAILNSPEEKYNGLMHSKLDGTGVEPWQYKEAMLEHNPWLDGHIGVGKGLELQFMDSRIALKLVRKWIVQKGRAIIPLHDGFYMEPEIMDEFKADMIKIYEGMKELNGFTPRVKQEIL